LTSLDALRIIRHLNRFSIGAAEPPPPTTNQAGHVDVVFALLGQDDNEDEREFDGYLSGRDLEGQTVDRQYVDVAGAKSLP